MPNRILKDSVCTSENLDSLSPGAEIFFYRLIVQCDDFGRLDARKPILRSKCFPLRCVTDEELSAWLKELCKADLIVIYEVEGKQYLQFKTWLKHQQKRAKHSKYPDMKSSDSNGNQLQSDAPEYEDETEESRIENRESNTRNENDSLLSEIRKLYENNICLLTPILDEELQGAIKEYSADYVVEAIKETVRNQKRKFSYTMGILRHWKQDGFKAGRNGGNNGGGQSTMQRGVVITKDGEIYA